MSCLSQSFAMLTELHELSRDSAVFHILCLTQWCQRLRSVVCQHAIQQIWADRADACSVRMTVVGQYAP